MKTVSWSWPNILVAYFGLFCFSLLDNIRGPYFPEILNHLKLTDTQGSFFFVVPSLLSLVGSRALEFDPCVALGVFTDGAALFGFHMGSFPMDVAAACGGLRCGTGTAAGGAAHVDSRRC